MTPRARTIVYLWAAALVVLYSGGIATAVHRTQACAESVEACAEGELP